MEFNRCFGCMRELDSPGAVCPHCEYDNTNDPKNPEKQPSHVLPCGTILNGRYVIGKKLGQGGFGITYIGWNLTLEMRVCIKEYFPDGAAMRSATQSRRVLWSVSKNAKSMQQRRDSFVEEARKAVRLRDLIHVVKVWDVFYENETAYIVMDYIEGETLKNRLFRTQKTLSERECVELLTPIMEDLESAHARGIIHRDIKPDNIMLKKDGKPVLLDMGAAKSLENNGQNNAQSDIPSSIIVVSKGFSPKEQYRSKGNIGPWTDVYAMCATIYYCVTGKVPPDSLDRDEGDELDLHMFSPAFAAALEKGLALKVEDRIQTMGELLEDLKSAVTEAAAEQNRKEEERQKREEEWRRLEEEARQAELHEREVKQKQEDGRQKQQERERLEQTQREKERKEAGKKQPGKNPFLIAAVMLIAVIGSFTVKSGTGGNSIKATATPKHIIPAISTQKPTSAQTHTPTAESTAIPATPTPAQTAELSSKALYNQGRTYADNGDYEKAIEYYRLAAEAGSSNAMNQLGCLYYNGEYVKKDYPEALRWFLKAANAGNTTGMYNSGLLNELGSGGVAKDIGAAMEWYRKAADRGYDSAKEKLEKLEREYAWMQWTDIKAIYAKFTSYGGVLAGIRSDGTVVCNRKFDFLADWKDIIAVSIGNNYLVGLKSDGTVVAGGDNSRGQCNTADWTDIVSVAAGNDYTIGVRKDGKVVAVGDNSSGEASVSDWVNVASVTADLRCTMGVTKSGYVYLLPYHTENDATGWSNIQRVEANDSAQTAGLKKDGTVVVGFGRSRDDRRGCDQVDDWRDIIDISVGYYSTIGLKKDGTVLAVGLNDRGQCNVSDWRDIVDIASGNRVTYGLRSDGTVVVAGNP